MSHDPYVFAAMAVLILFALYRRFRSVIPGWAENAGAGELHGAVAHAVDGAIAERKRTSLVEVAHVFLLGLSIAGMSEL